MKMKSKQHLEIYPKSGGVSTILKAKDGEYVHFVKASKQNPKTAVYYVRANYDALMLGTIKWYAQWRQYGFYPEPNTVFEKTCLNDIRNFVLRLNKKYYDSRKARKKQWFGKQ